MNSIIPRLTAAIPERMGSHFPSSINHSTGIDVDPNVTAHRATPSVGTAGLLYGFIRTGVGTILCSKFHLEASAFPHTLTRAPVSAVTDVIHPLTTTSTENSWFFALFVYVGLDTVFLETFTLKMLTL